MEIYEKCFKVLILKKILHESIVSIAVSEKYFKVLITNILHKSTDSIAMNQHS